MIEIRALREHDDRMSFRSGDPDFDRFFHQVAGGLGLQLLRFVLRLALQMGDDYGCVGVVVDAKPDAEAFYAKYGFVALDTLEGRSDARSAPAPTFLAIRAIQQAGGEPSPKRR